MTIVDPIPENTPCTNCNHKATEKYAHDMLGAVYGSFQYLCRCCVLRTTVDHLLKVAASAYELSVDLEHNPCE